MHSILRERRKLRELEVQFDVKDTATLVAACNKSKDNHEQHDAFLDWMENYVRFFEQLSISDSHQQAMEFAQLADVVVEDARTKELVRNAFCCLCSKIRDNNYGEEKLILALCYFLLSVDCQAFEGNPHHLTRLARDVIAKLGPEATFSRGTYPTHSVSLFALHHLCAVIHEIDPTELDHGKRNGLFQLLDQCLQNIISTQSYYPFCYQAMLTRQSLASMDSNRGTSSKEIWYRLFHALRGLAYFYQALAEVATLKIDVGSFDKSVEELTEAFAQHNIKSQDWFETVKELIHFRMLVQKDPEELENFKDYLEKVDEILENTTNKEDQLALRYTMIRQVTLLALDSPLEMAREWAVEEFFNFGTSHAQRKGWAEDKRILEALLDAVLEIHRKDEFGDRMEGVIDRMKFYFRTDEQSKTIINWMRITQWKRDDKRMLKSQDQKGGAVLFQKVKAELSLDQSISTSSEVQNELKEKYKRESKVPSLFDNQVSRHVYTLHHSLMLHKNERQNNGEKTMKQTPIGLEDLFKDKEVTPGKSVERVKQVFLFGNPGTGKTTIAKKLAYMWSVGGWGDPFDSLYLVPVRELVSIKYDDHSLRKRRNLQTAIANICFPGKDDEEYEPIRQQVKENLDKESTLVVFDGLDEGEQTTKEMMNSLQSKSCRVLVLSRPRNLQSERDSPTVEVECRGMNEEQLIEYIKSETSSTELVEHLIRHPAIWEISHVPVVANILTFLYNTKKESIFSEESSLDMFSLYRKMSLEIWNRFVDKTKSNMERNQIFEALEEIAFCALEDGQILIAQDLVHEISRNRQMRDVLRDCGFLLLKKEGVVYQFPHLSFQEFFAGQYLAHCLMSKDEEQKQKAIDFLTEHKYNANFKQMLLFMVQACIVTKGDKGYQEIELWIDSTPIALGYHLHLVLKLELLEAALSASKKQNWEKILNSTKVLEIALGSFRRSIWGNCELSYHPLVPFRIADILADVIDEKIKRDDRPQHLFGRTAKVAKYIPSQWESVMKLLKSRTSSGEEFIVEDWRRFVRNVILEEKEDFDMLPWEDYDTNNEHARETTMASHSKIGKLMPTTSDIMQEASESSSSDKSSYEFQTFSEDVDQGEEWPDRPCKIVKLMRRARGERLEELEDFLKLLIRQLIRSVLEEKSDLVELIREWSDDDKATKLKLIYYCLDKLEYNEEHTKETLGILWTLCKDDVHGVCNEAKSSLTHYMRYSREQLGVVPNTLLKLTECETRSCHSSVVQLIAIASKFMEGTHNHLNCLFLNLGEDDIKLLYKNVTCYIGRDVPFMHKEAMEMHQLHLLCLKALNRLGDEESELVRTIDEADAYPNKVVVMSMKSMSIVDFNDRKKLPTAVHTLAFRYPEYKEEIFDTLEKFTEDDDRRFAASACGCMISSLGTKLRRTEQIMRWFEEMVKSSKGLKIINGIADNPFNVDNMIRAYIECNNELLIPFILPKFFFELATMEIGCNGPA